MVILNFLKNVPTELLEHEMPNLLIRRYSLREDSGGAGRYRGGTGSIVEFETNVSFTTITARNIPSPAPCKRVAAALSSSSRLTIPDDHRTAKEFRISPAGFSASSAARPGAARRTNMPAEGSGVEVVIKSRVRRENRASFAARAA